MRNITLVLFGIGFCLGMSGCSPKFVKGDCTQSDYVHTDNGDARFVDFCLNKDGKVYWRRGSK